MSGSVERELYSLFSKYFLERLLSVLHSSGCSGVMEEVEGEELVVDLCQRLSLGVRKQLWLGRSL